MLASLIPIWLHDVGEKIAAYVVIQSALAEIAMHVYVLVIGVKTPKPDARTLAAC